MSQTFQILDGEWAFIDHYIQIQKTWWTTFVKPTHSEDIKEDRKWVKDVSKLVSVYTKLCIVQAQLREEKAKHDIQKYTWQKVPSTDKIGKKRLKLMRYVKEYYALKQRFVKEYKQLN